MNFLCFYLLEGAGGLPVT